MLNEKILDAKLGSNKDEEKTALHVHSNDICPEGISQATCDAQISDTWKADTNVCKVKVRESLGFCGIFQTIAWTLCLPVFAILCTPLALCRIISPVRSFITYIECFFGGNAKKFFVLLSKLNCFPVYWGHSYFELPSDFMNTDDGSCGRAALTFDDGPTDEEAMYLLLDLLREFNTKATFFVISNFAKIPGRDAVMRKIVEDGHQLANHGVRDRPMVCYGRARFKREVLECEEEIVHFDPSFLTKPKLFRPPCGLVSKGMMKTLRELGYTTVMTNCWSMDSNYANNPKWHTDAMLRCLEAGSIVCLHCPTKPGSCSRIQTLEITRSLLEEGKRQGIEFCSLAEVFK